MKPLLLFCTILCLALPLSAQVILLESPSSSDQIKRGESVGLDVESFAQKSPIQLELWHKDELEDFVVIPQGIKTYEWQLPKVKPAQHYRIKVVNQQNGTLLAQTEAFQIGRPWLRWGSIGSLTLLPVVALFLGRRHGVLGPPAPVPVR
ncbi:MAG: hypothetical protein AAFQ68_02840 [Bacteroidota bacterium]